MMIEKVHHNNVVILKVGQSATIQEASALKRWLEIKIEKEFKNFIIDLSECEFFDSTFIGALVVSIRKLKENNGKLKIIKPKDVFQSMLQMFNGSKSFEMYDTISEALNRLSLKNLSQHYALNKGI